MVNGQSRPTAILRSIQHLLRMSSKFGRYSKLVTGTVRGQGYYSEMKKKSFKLVTDQVLVIVCQTR